MRLRTRAFCLAITALIVARAAVPSAAPSPFAGIVVFGTSMSDSGNAFALVGGTSTPPDYDLDPFLVPSAPYARGGHHFSNGATWVEQLARSFALAGRCGPAFGSESPGATNYAVGAARVYARRQELEPRGIRFRRYLVDHGRRCAPGCAVVPSRWAATTSAMRLWPTRPEASPRVRRFSRRLLPQSRRTSSVLYGAGARRFLVWLPPNVALTPALRQLEQLSPGVAQLATAMTQAFNGGLSSVLMQLAALPGMNIEALDTYALLNDIVANPQRYGLTNVTGCMRDTERGPVFLRQSRQLSCSGTAFTRRARRTRSWRQRRQGCSRSNPAREAG